MFACFKVSQKGAILSSRDRSFIYVLSSTKFYILPFCIIYRASESDLNIIQLFLDRCHKRRFVSSPVSIKDLLYRQDCKILKAITSVDNHPLGSYLPPTEENKYNLRKKQCALPKVDTERFMTSYVNRLIFKHKKRQFLRSILSSICSLTSLIFRVGFY